MYVCVFTMYGTAVTGEKVCYPKLDCFEDNVPWGGTAERPIARLPWSPEKIGTRFLLYTSSNLDQFQASSDLYHVVIHEKTFESFLMVVYTK